MPVIAPLPHHNNTNNNGNRPPGENEPLDNSDLVNNNEGLVNNNEGLLTLQEIAARLDVGYGRLRGFAGVEGIGELLGAVDVPGVKGVRYEPRAVEAFRRLTQAQDAKQVIPGTARAWLEANQGAIVQPQQFSNGLSNGNGAQEIALPGDADLPAPRGLAAILAPLADLPAALRDLAAALKHFPKEWATPQVTPAVTPQVTPPDRLLSAEDAAALLACSPRAVSRYVPPVLPRKWRESDILAYIAGLGGESEVSD